MIRVVSREVLFLVLERETCLYMEIYVTYTKGNLCAAFRLEGTGQRVNYFQLKTILKKSDIFRVTYSDPLH